MQCNATEDEILKHLGRNAGPMQPFQGKGELCVVHSTKPGASYEMLCMALVSCALRKNSRKN